MFSSVLTFIIGIPTITENYDYNNYVEYPIKLMNAKKCNKHLLEFSG